MAVEMGFSTEFAGHTVLYQATAAVPVPVSAILSGTGMLALAGMGRNRR